ncbi:MAG: glycine-rich protein, partial [Firmicutes bacterium]|nr:glycine-rich protein [Bacillota bacterium]
MKSNQKERQSMRNGMKKAIVAVVLLLSVLIFAACSVALWDNDRNNIHDGCCDTDYINVETETGGNVVETAAVATTAWNPAQLTYNFSLTNNTQALTNIPAGARFRIEVWGASGGGSDANHTGGGRGGRSVGDFQNMTNAPMNLQVQVAGPGAGGTARGGGGGGASAVWANAVSTANVLVVGGGGGGGVNGRVGGAGGGGNANGANAAGSRQGFGGNNNGTGGNGSRCCCGG